MRRDVQEIPGLKLITAKTFHDERGFLLQSWVDSDLKSENIPFQFKQAIQTHSKLGVVRGLHFQWAPPMGKYVRCVHGGVIDVVVDVRHGSPTQGDHAAVELTDSNHSVIWVPPGFAHGTFSLADDTIVLYECTSAHGPGCEGGIRWNDPALGIEYPDIPTIVSEKDQAAPTFAEWLSDPRSKEFTFKG